MKRYKLLKDLAGLKAGSTLYLNELGNLVAEDKTTIVFLASFIHFYNILDSDWFEEIPEGYKRWRADIFDWYWYVGAYGAVSNDRDSRVDIDDMRYLIGNYFKTEEEAEKAAKWLKALAILRDDTKGFKPNWEDDSQPKWAVKYGGITDELSVFCSLHARENIIFFATRDDAEESIRKHECQWLTYLNVEE